MLMKYRILLIGNTVEMAGGDMYIGLIFSKLLSPELPMNLHPPSPKNLSKFYKPVLFLALYL